MARPALATIGDLEVLLGYSITPGADSDQAQARLENASEIVRAYAGVDWLNDAEDAPADVPGAIPGLVAGVVERATRNPSGIVQETAGPFGRSFGADAAQRLYLTAAEKAVIRRAAGRSQLGSIATTRDSLETAGPCSSAGGDSWWRSWA